MKENFTAALKLVLVHEGGYVNHPRDPGGPTNKGITQRVYDLFRSDKGLPIRSVKNIAANEIAAIYKQRYWDAIRGDELPSGIDYVVFDGAVNSGPGQSVKWLQRALGSAYAGKVDGHIGLSTLSATKASPNHDALVSAISGKRLAFLRALKHWGTFGKGWSARVADVTRVGQDWASGGDTKSTKVSFITGGNAKAPLESAAPAPWTAPADIATGGGLLTTMLSQVTEQLTPYADIEFIGKAVAWLTVAGVVVMVGGVAWRIVANWRAKQRYAALDLMHT